MIKDKLQIYLITYNRRKFLQMTLEQIFADNSPVKDYDITILNNASFDGTDELIEEYQKKFPNLEHIKHKINIGGNANICRAYEMAGNCRKEYAWILCDDDILDFSSWQEVVDNINLKKDIICVSNYAFPNENYFSNIAYQMFQLTFVPAMIFRVEHITNSVLIGMYDAIYSMFQQNVLYANVYNKNGGIYVLKKTIVHNGCQFKSRQNNASYTRGIDEKKLITERKEKTSWILGYSNIITLLNNKKLEQECMEIAIPHTGIYQSFSNFYNSMKNLYFNFKNFNYFYEIFKQLPLRRKIEQLIFCLPFVSEFAGFLKTILALIKINFHNLMIDFKNIFLLNNRRINEYRK